jgi:hypothetical protein
MSWRWRRQRETERVPASAPRREARAGERLAQEVEAFLGGSSKEWLLTRGRDVPAWAYLNQVTHAEPDVLRELAASAPEATGDGLSWRAAVALLAQEILEIGGSDSVSIRRIQIDQLVTLESQLLSPVSRAVAPETLVALGRARLRDRPSCEPPL